MSNKPTYLTGDDAIWAATFRNNLKYIKYSKKIRTCDLCRKLGMKQHEFENYLNKKIRPGDEMSKKIAEALECAMDELLDEDGNPWNFGKSAKEIAELNAKRKKEREDHF